MTNQEKRNAIAEICGLTNRKGATSWMWHTPDGTPKDWQEWKYLRASVEKLGIGLRAGWPAKEALFYPSGKNYFPQGRPKK